MSLIVELDDFKFHLTSLLHADFRAKEKALTVRS